MPQVGPETVGSIYEASQGGLGMQAPTSYHQFSYFQGREDTNATGRSQGAQNITVIYHLVTYNIVIVSALCPESVLFLLFCPPQHTLLIWGLLLTRISQVKRKLVSIDVRSTRA